MGVVYFIFGAFARRWFGGMFPDEKYKILGNRALQTGVMIGLFLSIYITDYYDWKNIALAIAISCWLQFQFWSRGHGCCYDQGRGGQPSAETIKRYNERWYHKPCDWLADKFGFEQYGKLYDFCYMTLRYTCPMIPMMYFDWRYILVGLAVAPIYAFCWCWYESEEWLFEKQEWCDKATELAELLCGGMVYLCCYWLGA